MGHLACNFFGVAICFSPSDVLFSYLATGGIKALTWRSPAYPCRWLVYPIRHRCFWALIVILGVVSFRTSVAKTLDRLTRVADLWPVADIDDDLLVWLYWQSDVFGALEPYLSDRHTGCDSQSPPAHQLALDAPRSLI